MTTSKEVFEDPKHKRYTLAYYEHGFKLVFDSVKGEWVDANTVDKFYQPNLVDLDVVSKSKFHDMNSKQTYDKEFAEKRAQMILEAFRLQNELLTEDEKSNYASTNKRQMIMNEVFNPAVMVAASSDFSSPNISSSPTPSPISTVDSSSSFSSCDSGGGCF